VLLAGGAAIAQSGARVPAELLDEARREGEAQSLPAGGGAAALEGAVDPERYVLGPGDLLEIAYVGMSQPSERVRVTPSGRVHLKATGPVAVAGLKLAEAEERLRKELQRFYGGTRITVDLLEVRTFRVHLLGHVERPGAFTVRATQRASDLLDDAELLRERASLRNLTLRRQDGTVAPVDLLRYRLLGDMEFNPHLQDGDVLVVPAKKDSVSVFGRVARQGFLEFRDGDTIGDLIALSGGFDAGADTSEVELRRFDPTDPDRSTKRTLDLGAGDASLAVEPGDGVYVRAQPNHRRERLVEIWGEVLYPGVYAIEKDRETLRTLIQRAGGFTAEADPAGTEIYRPGVFDRPEDDPEFLRLQAIPVQEMSHDEFEYLKLRSRQREGLASAVLAESLTRDDGGERLVLRSGDIVRVPPQNLAVDVQGAVKNPGFVPWEASRAATDYIDIAGGKTERARTGNTRVIRSRTGERVRAEGDTRVDPGDLVWVPEKPDRDWWRITRETVTFLAQIGTLVVIIDSVNN
jgi:protein involved in polysaccharide export with SLBB domain